MPRSGRTPIALACLLAVAAPVAGQGYRGELTGRGTVLEIRPLVRDSIPESAVPGEGLRRRLPSGEIATCIPNDFCRWYRSGPSDTHSILTQDLRVSGWGGPRGLSARVHLRGRFGSEEFWPGTRRTFDVVHAYVDYDRGSVRVQGGRISRADGLGYYNFDGVSALWRGNGRYWVEVYGGSSLVPGLNEPRTGDLLAETEDLPPDDRGWLLGARAGGRLGPVSGSVAYQRDVRTDRLAIYSERVAADARALVGLWLFDASLEYDWMTGALNDARLRVTAALSRSFEIGVEGRHYEPFFESWTIWGAFSPVGFNEGRASAAWRSDRLGLRLEASGAHRWYEDTGAQLEAQRVRESGWRLAGAVSWDRRGWTAVGSYYADVGPGAARFGGDVSGGRTFGAGRELLQ